MKNPADKTTKFRNVDLEIFAKFDLRPLVDAFGEIVTVLHVGRERGLYSTQLELNGQVKTAEGGMRGFITLIRGLPRLKRKLWDAAKIRDFNIGVQSSTQHRPFEIKLAGSTLNSVVSLNALVIVTVYAPEQPTPVRGLGTEIASLFKKAGLKAGIRELRGHEIKPAFRAGETMP